MTTLNEGDEVMVLDDAKLVACEIVSFYPFKDNEWMVLKCRKTGREYRRPKTMFVKPDKGIKIHSP